MNSYSSWPFIIQKGNSSDLKALTGYLVILLDTQSNLIVREIIVKTFLFKYLCIASTHCSWSFLPIIHAEKLSIFYKISGKENEILSLQILLVWKIWTWVCRDTLLTAFHKLNKHIGFKGRTFKKYWCQTWKNEFIY